MDAQFWVGIAIGSILSIVIGFYVNLQTPKVQAWLDSRRRLRGLHDLKWEKNTYGLVLRLMSNKDYAAQYYNIRIAELVFFATLTVCAWMLFPFFILLRMESRMTGTLSWLSGMHADVFYTALFVFVGLIAFFFAVAFFRHAEVITKLGDLEAYRDELQKRWPHEIWEPASDADLRSLPWRVP
jgi:hypothetical protein